MKNIFLRLLVTWGAMFAITTFAQQSQRVDSLLQIARAKDDTNAVNARVQLFWEYSAQNINMARLHLDTASLLRSSKGYIKGLADINRGYGFYYSSFGLLDKAAKYFNISKEQYKKTGNKVGINNCLNGLGIIEGQRGNLNKALEYYLLVEKGNIELGDEKAVAKTKINIGMVYYMLGDYKKANDYYETAYQILKKSNDLYGLMHVYSKKATNYLELKEYNKALDYLYKSRDIARELKDSTQQLTIEQNIGSYYTRIGKPDSALIQYYNYKALSEHMGLKQHVAIAQLYIGLGEHELGHTKKAIQATEAGIQIANEIGDKWRIMNGYDLLAEIYRSQGNYKLAFEYSKLGNQLQDSLKGVEVANKVNELQAIYNLDEKESENKILQEQNIHKQLKVKQLYTLITGLSILLFSIVIFVLLFIRQKKIKSRLIQSELEQKALRAQMNPHFIFNALNSIQRLYVDGKEDVANEYIADFSRLLRSILENSGKQSIQLSEELALTKLYLDIEKLRTDNLFNYEIHIDKNLDIANISFPPLIFQPYLENAIWHGILPSQKKGLIRINILRKSQTTLLVEITDNGVGILKSMQSKKEINRHSLGIQITSQRLGGTKNVKAEELKEGGTKISLTIKMQ